MGRDGQPIKYVLKGVIAKDQKDYICGVIEWLHAGIPRDRFACGPEGMIPLKPIIEED